MISVYHSKNETSENCKVSLSLLAEILKHELKDQLLRLREAMDVENTEHLEPVVVNILVRVETWDRGYAVNEEVAAIERIILLELVLR